MIFWGWESTFCHCFPPLLLAMMCFTQLYVCARVGSAALGCCTRREGSRVGGWAGSMDIKPDSTGTGALASK